MNNKNPGSSNSWFNTNYPLSQNPHQLYYSYSNENYLPYSTNPTIQHKVPLFQQNYFNCGIPLSTPPSYPPYYNYNFENKLTDFTVPHDVIKPYNKNSEIGKTKKNRRERTTYSKSQLQILESYFQINAYPDITIREAISMKIHISENNIQVWFKNRRAKQKKSLTKNHRDKSTPSTEDSIIMNSNEISNPNSSTSEIETLHSSGKLYGTISSETNSKYHQTDSNQLHFMNNEINNNNNNNNNNILNTDQNVFYNNHLSSNSHFQQSPYLHVNYMNYLNQAYETKPELI